LNNEIVPNRKFFTEMSVSLFTQDFRIFPADQIHNDLAAEESGLFNDMHIYLICKRPRFCFDPLNLRFDGRKCSGQITYRIGENNLYLPFSFDVTDTQIDRMEVEPYPHSNIQSYDHLGQAYKFFPAYIVFISSHITDLALRSFEVLYVGQSFAEGTRNAFDRLKNHSTLQKILARGPKEFPDDEISIITFDFAPYRIYSSFDGRSKSDISDERDNERWRKAHSAALDTQTQISLAEAGLIRYFDPKYNRMYRKSFPKFNQKILDKCYYLDFIALVVEINVEDSGTPIFS